MFIECSAVTGFARRVRWRHTVLVLMLGASASLEPRVHAQGNERQDPGADRIPPIDYAEAATSLAPVVEAITGRRFTTVPRVIEVSSAAALESLRDDELLLLPSDAATDEAEAGWEQFVREGMYRAFATHLLARYSISRKDIFVIRENLDAALARADCPPDEVHNVIRLVLVHELSHAIQDQAVGLPALVRRHHERDRLAECDAAIEGFAFVVQDEAAKRLGLGRAADVLQRINPVAAVEEPSALRSDDLPARRRGLARKVMNLKLVSSGPEGMWAALQDAPAALVFTPSKPPDAETVAALDRGDARMSAVLDGLAEKFKLRGSPMILTRVNPMLAMQPFKLLPPERRAELAGMCRVAHSLFCTGTGKGDLPEAASVTLYELAPGADPASFSAAIKEGGRLAADAMRLDGVLSGVVHESAGVALETGVNAEFLLITASTKGKMILRMQWVWTSCEGCVLLMVTTYDVRLTTMYEVLNEIVRRLRASSPPANLKATDGTSTQDEPG